MPISLEGKIGISLALLALGGAGAVMVAPEQLWIGWGMIGIATVGGVALAMHHFERTIRGASVLVLIGTGMIISGGIIGMVGALKMDALPARTDLRKKTGIEPPKLLDLFKADFPALLKLEGERVASLPGAPDYKFTSKA